MNKKTWTKSLTSCSNSDRPNRKNCTPAARFQVEMHSLQIEKKEKKNETFESRARVNWNTNLIWIEMASRMWDSNKWIGIWTDSCRSSASFELSRCSFVYLRLTSVKTLNCAFRCIVKFQFEMSILVCRVLELREKLFKSTGQLHCVHRK